MGRSIAFGAAIATTALLLNACTQSNPILTPSTTQIVPSETAYAVPGPGGPPISAVLERRFSNGTQQDILLASTSSTPGENSLRVQFFGPVDRQMASLTPLKEGLMHASGGGSEMASRLPGVPMQRSPYYVQNKYGPFGYAMGRSRGDTCIFGWQRITSTGQTQKWIGNKGAIQIQLRLCEAGASEQQLLQVMYGFTIRSFFKDGAWNPYGEPLGPDETLGRSGNPVYPLGETRFEGVLAETPVAAAPPRRRVVAAAPAAPELPDPVGPAVPPPPGGAVSDAGVTIPPPPCGESGGSC